LVAAVRSLQEEGVGLVFVGEGAQRTRIEAFAKGTPNVRFLSFFPASKLRSVLAAPDAHVITVKRGLEGVVVPSKMYGILAAGKPIVAVAVEETDVASLGAKFGFAVSADPDSPTEVASAIRSLAGDSVKVRSMGRAARAVAPDYDRVKELQKFVKIIEEAAGA
jgi:colanic acid biosynthesis glycosyl transferase WcaI